MAKFIIKGGKQLKGTIKISGAKNAALKILPAAILADSPSTICNVPDIADIQLMIKILESIGAKVKFENNIVEIDPEAVKTSTPDAHLIKKLRGSIVLVGPLLAKFGNAKISQPGGCLIGARPIDDHLDVFKQLGINITENDEEYSLKGKPQAAKVVLSKMSVTATENAMMAAVLSSGTTKIVVAAAEPEIVDLALYLNKMGARISGAGTHEIIIKGVDRLHGVEHLIIPDRIEAGTYIMAAIATNSEVEIGPFISDHLNVVLKKLKYSGANFDIFEKDGQEYIKTQKHGQLKAQDIDTRTYPGFPTDLQSPYVVLMTQAQGECTIFETIFEGRFLFLDEIKIMGAKTEILSPHIVKVIGPTKLSGQNIYSRDLRGGAALVIAGLVAKGTTVITNIEFINRGYENMDKKLAGVGADIRRIE